MTYLTVKSILPIFSKEVCDDLLCSSSISAFRAHKSVNEAVYQAELNNLAEVCACLLIAYNQKPQSIVNSIEAAIEEVHHEEINDINYQINHLFHLRKQAPANTTYGEQEIIKLTTKIDALEELKSIPIKEAIEDVIRSAIEKAVDVIGAQIPADFNLTQYEYLAVGSKNV